jgi:hypothetical protein
MGASGLVYSGAMVHPLSARAIPAHTNQRYLGMFRIP